MLHPPYKYTTSACKETNMGINLNMDISNTSNEICTDPHTTINVHVHPYEEKCEIIPMMQHR